MPDRRPAVFTVKTYCLTRKKCGKSCEHGGNQIPEEFAGYFADQLALLATHRGWDIGALELYRNFAEAGADAAFFSETSRLLVELNRTENKANFFSAITEKLSVNVKSKIVEFHYKPYRSQVENAIQKFLE